MAHQPNRGSKWATLISIQSTLQLALDGSGDEKQLRQYIKTIIKTLQPQIDKLAKRWQKIVKIVSNYFLYLTTMYYICTVYGQFYGQIKQHHKITNHWRLTWAQ